MLPLYCFLKYFINISFKINIFFCFLFLMYLIFLSIDCFTIEVKKKFISKIIVDFKKKNLLCFN